MYGRYTLQYKIGKGGYSTVYKCVDDVGLQYACKVLPKVRNKKHKVMNEVNIMKHLQKCPTTIKIIDHNENELSYYIIQEYSNKGNLFNILEEHKTSDEKKIQEIIYKLLLALHDLHNNDVIHGDIKSDNIFIFDNVDGYQLKLGDFGNSIITSKDKVEVLELSGTPHYMAPENLRSIYCKTSDVWSLGVMTYNIICGNFPFDDKPNPYKPSLPIVWKSIISDEPVFKEKQWLFVSDCCKDFIKQCLIKDYTYRPSIEECLIHKWILG